MMSESFDVAVVGLGPTGAILSALLGRHGVKTLVIDKLDDIFPLPRAVSFDHEVMRVIQNLGLADAIQSFVVPYPPTEYRGADGGLIARYESLPPPHPQGWQPSFMFKQPPFERAIRKSLSDLPLLDVRLGRALTGLRQNHDHVELEIATASGAAETLRAQYVIGCDGGTSPVRKLNAIGLETLDFDEPWLVVDILVNNDGLKKLPRTVVQYCDPARPTTYVVGSGNHRRWEFMMLPGETPEQMNDKRVIWRLLERWLTPQDGELWRAATYVFHALVAREWRRGRVFLAGDAAHMTPPFMAQGMCQGVRDAANLAWKLALVIKGQSDPKLLDSYQRERRAHVKATTETAKSLGRVICELDPAKALERDARLRREMGDPPATQYRQNLIPGLEAGALCSTQGAPVGLRFPQPRIALEGRIDLLDDVVGASLRLVVCSGVAIEIVPEALRRRIIGLGGAVLSLADRGLSRPLAAGEWLVVETEGVLNRWFCEHGLLAVLVRPDHYVFAIARQPHDLDAMGDLIDEGLHLAGGMQPASLRRDRA